MNSKSINYQLFILGLKILAVLLIPILALRIWLYFEDKEQDKLFRQAMVKQYIPKPEDGWQFIRNPFKFGDEPGAYTLVKR